MASIHRILSSKTAICLGILLGFSTSSLSAQDWVVPRTADGKPDLQGIWTNASQTPLQRSRDLGTKGYFTADEAAEQEADWRNYIARRSADSDPDRAPPTDGNTDLGYNNFWVDRGTNVIELGGEFRTSIIVEPDDGRIPTVEGFRSNSLITEFRNRSGVENYDSYELRPLGERCLLSFGSSSGPPMLPVMYNNNYQIVQTPDHVMILVEMVHDARIIPLDKNHHSTDFNKWMGDSVGYWEEDTLVVKTQNFHPLQSFRGSSDQTIVTEYFELIEADKIKYRFTVEDPASYTRPWSGEVAMNRRPVAEPIYEYACHEGNYAFNGILAGARRLEVQPSNTP